ncbi:MAG TPA: hypothetical protein VNA87_05890 [Actinomycetota bacterium]|nr:hypothetical protein [Actinomycetota bacterium]
MRQNAAIAVLIGAVLANGLASCEPNESRTSHSPQSPSSPQQDAPYDKALKLAGTELLAFLRGERALDGITTAPQVTLYLVNEGGGGKRVLEGAALAERENWKVQSGLLGRDVSFLPPAEEAGVSMRVGKHYNCMTYDLETRVSDLPLYPHVGVRLMPITGPQTCLRSWNVTFLFEHDSQIFSGGEATLVGAIYDQWEW